MTAMLSRPPAVRPAPTGGLATPSADSPEVQAFRAGLVHFTWSDLEKMWQAGILNEDSTIELLDGLLVYRDCGGSDRGPYLANPAHDWTITRLGQLARQVDGPTRHMRTQATLLLSETYDPIPDAMILRGSDDDYRHRQPTAVDAICLIEVADTSYVRDAGNKLRAYAAAGVPQYVIIDLRRRLAEVYAGPDASAGTYPSPVIVPAEGSVDLRVGEAETVAVPLADLLP